MEEGTIILSATGEMPNTLHDSLKLLNPKEGTSNNNVGTNACNLADCSKFVTLQY
jgi:hypothetical protein